MIAIPVAPHVNVATGELFPYITAIAFGPVYGAIAGVIAWTYTFLLWGHPIAILTYGIFQTVACAFLVKWIRPLWSMLVSWFVVSYPSTMLLLYLWGYPLVTIFIITFAANAAMIIATVVAALLIQLPAFRRVIPGWTAPEYGLFFRKKK
jgi:hypothetical protein